MKGGALEGLGDVERGVFFPLGNDFWRGLCLIFRKFSNFWCEVMCFGAFLALF